MAFGSLVSHEVNKMRNGRFGSLPMEKSASGAEADGKTNGGTSRTTMAGETNRKSFWIRSGWWLGGIGQATKPPMAQLK